MVASLRRRACGTAAVFGMGYAPGDRVGPTIPSCPLSPDTVAFSISTSRLEDINYDPT
jgi:hypothetical protein